MGAGTQHSLVGGSRVAPISLTSLKVVWRWMMKTWSRESTPTPMVEPRIQWLGSGLGQSGSTSKMGASPDMSGAWLADSMVQAESAMMPAAATQVSA